MRAPFNRRSKPEASSEDGGTWGTVRFVLGLALLAWAIRSFLFAPFNIPSGSMLPTLYIGDYLMVAKWPYGYSSVSFPFGFPRFDGRVLGNVPKRGDVVVFRHPSEPTDLIKRVIGIPGDTVAVRDGRVALNGRLLPLKEAAPAQLPASPNTPCKTVPPAAPRISQSNGRTVCQYRAYREVLPGGVTHIVLDQVDGGPADNFGPTRVPPGHVFLMGDNRDDSLDSRFSAAEGGVGMVPMDRLIGRAAFTFWSTDGSAAYLLPWTWFTALRADRIGNGYAESSR
jgi:signal peptidase I